MSIVEGIPERIITLWFADWPALAAGFAPDVPAAVMSSDRVVARTPAAAANGVVVGQRRHPHPARRRTSPRRSQAGTP
jgi:protein ImuB